MNSEIIEKAKGALVGFGLSDVLIAGAGVGSGNMSSVNDLIGAATAPFAPHTGMLLCLSDSLIEHAEYRRTDVEKRFLTWLSEQPCVGECNGLVGAGITQSHQLGVANGDSVNVDAWTVVAVCAPLALLAHQSSLYPVLHLAEQVCSDRAVSPDVCQYLCSVLHCIFNASEPLEKALLLGPDGEFPMDVLKLQSQTHSVVSGSYRIKSINQLSGASLCLALEAALWCFWHSDSFAQALQLAAQVADDTKTVALMVGQLAGAYYGYQSFPAHWVESFALGPELIHRGCLLLARQSNRVVHQLIERCRNAASSAIAANIAQSGLVLDDKRWIDWVKPRSQLQHPGQVSSATMAQCLSWLNLSLNSDTSGNVALIREAHWFASVIARLATLSGYVAPGHRYLFIGDVHGQYQKLDALLAHQAQSDVDDDTFYVFVGDIIDNKIAPEICHESTLARVKALVDAGRAECLLGNHELNAIGWVMRDPITGMPLRSHSESNTKQHAGFLQDVGENSPAHRAWVEWFKLRPLFVDYGDIRAIHACWDQQAINRLQPYLHPDNSLKEEHWPHAFDRQHELYHLLELLLKGPELALPSGHSFFDKTGTQRRQIRVRWWLDEAADYRQLAQVPREAEALVPDLPLPTPHQGNVLDVPVVIGHYTLSGMPQVLSDKVVCVDFNAAKDHYPLVGFEWISGELSRVDNQGIKYMDQPELELMPLKGVAALLTAHIEGLRQQHVSPSVLDAVQHFLWQEWDPLGVRREPDGAEEYSIYTTDTALLAVAGDIDILCAWFWTLELDLMGEQWDDQGTRAQAAQCAIRLIESVKYICD